MTGPSPIQDATIGVRALVVGALENNVYTIVCRRSGDAALVDAAAEPERILDWVADLPITAILTTHGHFDHVGAAAAVSRALGVGVRIHPADAAMAGLDTSLPIRDGEIIRIGDLAVRAIHTPGHTPGSTCFQVGDLLFSGDTLFPGGPGATGGDPSRFAEIMRSLEEHLFVLPDRTRVLPGHGLDTTIGEERPSLPEWWRRGY